MEPRVLNRCESSRDASGVAKTIPKRSPSTLRSSFSTTSHTTNHVWRRARRRKVKWPFTSFFACARLQRPGPLLHNANASRGEGVAPTRARRAPPGRRALNVRTVRLLAALRPRPPHRRASRAAPRGDPTPLPRASRTSRSGAGPSLGGRGGGDSVEPCEGLGGRRSPRLGPPTRLWARSRGAPLRASSRSRPGAARSSPWAGAAAATPSSPQKGSAGASAAPGTSNPPRRGRAAPPCGRRARCAPERRGAPQGTRRR